MKSLKAKLQLPKPNLDKRERDEKLAERLQKKLADPKSPSNSPMVKKLKVRFRIIFVLSLKIILAKFHAWERGMISH